MKKTRSLLSWNLNFVSVTTWLLVPKTQRFYCPRVVEALLILFCVPSAGTCVLLCNSTTVSIVREYSYYCESLFLLWENSQILLVVCTLKMPNKVQTILLIGNSNVSGYKISNHSLIPALLLNSLIALCRSLFHPQCSHLKMGRMTMLSLFCNVIITVSHLVRMLRQNKSPPLAYGGLSVNEKLTKVFPGLWPSTH
jgi:hypothetical protein